MANEIIDITRYLNREPASDVPRGSMALWGADGERSRFALPLWRVIYLAEAERGLILWSRAEDPRVFTPLVVLDLVSDPARTEPTVSMIPDFGPDEGPRLYDLDAEGLVVHLGTHGNRIWVLQVDGGSQRTSALAPRTREDVLFLAGECAGLLFFRDLADESDGKAEDE